MNAYPSTVSARKAGMARFRAEVLASAEKALANADLLNISQKDREALRGQIETIKAAQKRFGEV